MWVWARFCAPKQAHHGCGLGVDAGGGLGTLSPARAESPVDSRATFFQILSQSSFIYKILSKSNFLIRSSDRYLLCNYSLRPGNASNPIVILEKDLKSQRNSSIDCMLSGVQGQQQGPAEK